MAPHLSATVLLSISLICRSDPAQPRLEGESSMSPPLPSSVYFSWDTVQPFFHADNVTGSYSDAAIAQLARFPLVTLEKWHGACSNAASGSSTCPSIDRSSYSCCEEDRILHDLQRVKAVNSVRWNRDGADWMSLNCDIYRTQQPSYTSTWCSISHRLAGHDVRLWVGCLTLVPQYRLHTEMQAHPDWALALANGSRCLMAGDSGPATRNPKPSHGMPVNSYSSLFECLHA